MPAESLDPLLVPLSQAKTPAEVSQRFDTLWETVSREVRQALSGRTLSPEQISDLTADAGMRLYAQLCEQWTQKRFRIGNLRAYTRRIARNLYCDRMRQERPLWRQVQARVLLTAVHHPRLILRDKPRGRQSEIPGAGDAEPTQNRTPGKELIHTEWMTEPGMPSLESQAFLDGKYADFIERRLSNRTPTEIAGDDLKHLYRLMEALLLYVGVPLDVSEMVYHLSRLLEYTDRQVESLEARRELHGMEIAADTDDFQMLLDTMEQRDILRLFGRFLRTEPLRQTECAAVTLNQDAAFLIGRLELYMTELAVLLGFTEDRFETFRTICWQNLPLNDESIADACDVEESDVRKRRTLISNSRMIVLTRKWPAWQRRHAFDSSAVAAVVPRSKVRL